MNENLAIICWWLALNRRRLAGNHQPKKRSLAKKKKSLRTALETLDNGFPFVFVLQRCLDSQSQAVAGHIATVPRCEWMSVCPTRNKQQQRRATYT